MAKLSVVISAFNEEKKIGECLESVRQLADEVVVVNNSSIDKTEEIAKKYTDKIFLRPNLLMLNTNKNFGFLKATGEWILSLDADERVTPELAEEIKEKLENSGGINGYHIPRKNIIFSKWIKHSLWWPDYQLRLFRNGIGKFPEKHVHEKIEVTGETEKLKESMLHYNYATVSEFIYKMDKIYTENEAEIFLSSGKKLTWLDALRFPINDFLKTFFAQKGYKDGLHGLVLSILQAFYAEIVFAKIWERQKFWEVEGEDFLTNIDQEVKKIRKEFKYWLWESKIGETKNSIERAIYKVKRKIGL